MRSSHMAVHSEQAFPFNLLSSDCNDTLKDSLANTLQHSREEAQATYDRRTAVEKKSNSSFLGKGSSTASITSHSPRAPIRTRKTEDKEASENRAEFLLLWWNPSVHCRNQIFCFHVCKPCFLREWQPCLHLYGMFCPESLDSLIPIFVKPAKGRPNA